MEKRQRFTVEFKREALRLLKTSGKPTAVVARELGVPRNRQKGVRDNLPCPSRDKL